MSEPLSAASAFNSPEEIEQWTPETPDVQVLLRESEIVGADLLPWGSNYTFLVTLDAGGGNLGLGVYKPRQGEAPLYDFPSGTLFRREYGSYLLSQLLGWDFVPPTVLRDGPHGVGSVQLFMPSVKGASYFTFREERTADLQRMAAFDCLTNNADRKAGHCLLGLDGRIWGIDHGLTFNSVMKLRTVIWDFQTLPIPDVLLDDLERLAVGWERREPGVQAVLDLINEEEQEALRRRLDALLTQRVFPAPGAYRSVPWPPV